MYYTTALKKYLEEGFDRTEYLAAIRMRAAGVTSTYDTSRVDNSITPPTRFFIVPPYRAIAYGTTENNRREFRFLQTLIKKEVPALAVINLADQPYVNNNANYKHIKKVFNKEIWNLIATTYYSKARATNNSLLIDFYATFARCFYSFLASLSARSIRETVPFSIVSNDHAPIPIAFSQACRTFGIPVGYIQHAEVTEGFPPLAFDFAVLNNYASLKIYKRIDPNIPKCFVLSRHKEKFNKSRLKHQPAEPVSVGLFLTSLCRFDRLNELLAALQKNDHIRDIQIQPHPRTSQNNVRYLKSLGVHVAKKIDLDSIDVAVCQNTSYSIELLHHGIKTFQIFEFDDVADDHYGFVRSGLVPRLNYDDVGECFWRRFIIDEAWQLRFSDYNPFVNDSNQRKEFLQYISALRERETLRNIAPGRSNEAPNLKPTGNVGDGHSGLRTTLRGLGLSRSEIEFAENLIIQPHNVLNALEVRNVKRAEKIETTFPVNAARKVYKQTQAYWEPSLGADKHIEVMMLLHAQKIPEFYSTYQIASRFKPTAPELIWLQLQSLLHLWAPLTAFNWGCFIEIVKHKKENPKVVRILKTLAFRAVIHRKNKEALSILVDSEIICFQALNERELAAICNSFVGIWDTEFPSLQDEVKKRANVNTFEAYRLGILSGQLNLFSAPRRHIGIVDAAIRFFDSPSVQYEIASIVLPIYFENQSRLTHMDVRFSSKQRHALVTLFKASLARKQGFSFVRLSDGEGYLFHQAGRFFSRKEALNRERHWWGEELVDSMRKEVIKSNLSAVSSADVVGIPSSYRFLNDWSARLSSIKDSGGGVTGRGLLEVLHKFSSFTSADTILTEEKANEYLFPHPNSINELIDAAVQVIVVCSVKPELVKQMLDQPKKITVLNIPTHFLTSGNPKFVSDKRPLPHVLDDLIVRLKSLCEPGTLVLVSAGVAGKAFLKAGKECGAVSLDLGHTINRWIDCCESGLLRSS